MEVASSPFASKVEDFLSGSTSTSACAPSLPERLFHSVPAPTALHPCMVITPGLPLADPPARPHNQSLLCSAYPSLLAAFASHTPLPTLPTSSSISLSLAAEGETLPRTQAAHPIRPPYTAKFKEFLALCWLGHTEMNQEHRMFCAVSTAQFR